MRRSTAALLASASAGSLLALVPATPAGAAVNATAVGTIVTVTVTGDETVGFSCSGGTFRVNGSASTPSVPCANLSAVNVGGDAGEQTVRGDQLTKATFPALVSNSFNTGAGNDAIYTSKVGDSVNAGAGADGVLVDISGAADSGDLILGANAGDTLYLDGTSGNDEMKLSSTGTNGNISTKVGSGSAVGRGYSGAKGFVFNGFGGKDTLDVSSMQVVHDFVTLDGGAGDDTLKSGATLANLYGGAGTNTFVGGAATDSIFTASETDVINGGAGSNVIVDDGSLRSGGRSIAEAPAAFDRYENLLGGSDAVWRVRNGPSAGKSKATASLHRPGIQQLPSTVDTIVANFTPVGSAPADHTLADIVAQTDAAVIVSDGTKKTTLVDITIPTGSWTTSGTIGNGSGIVDPTAPTLGTITLSNVGPVSVHAPWANQNRGWGHRAIRDLQFRFASSSELNDIQGDLDAAGAITRTSITAALMGTDLYRGLDVDRVFVDYLRRAADPGGRTYWINSLANGKALWRFRAQLFGSNEYFTKAGGTNAAYVKRAYNDVLGRDPDPSGQTYWTNKLDGGADRGSVALQFINSPESRRRLVDDQFLRFLGRLPTSTEQTTWVDQIPSADGEQRLIASLVTSAEYFALT